MRRYLDNEITCSLSVLGLGYSLFMYCWMLANRIAGQDVFAFAQAYLPKRYSAGTPAIYSTIFLVLCCAFFGLIVRCTAYYHGEAEPKLSFMDKVPIEIFAVIFGAVFVVCFMVFARFFFDGWNRYERVIYTMTGDMDELGFSYSYPFEVFIALYSGMYARAVFSLMTVVARIKCHSFWSTCLTFKIAVWCVNLLGKIWRRVTGFFAHWFGFVSLFFKNITYLKKLVIFTTLSYIVLLLLYGNWHHRLGGYYWIAFTIVCAATFAIAVSLALGYEKIRTAIAEISAGNTTYKTDTKYMTPTMAEQAQNLNNIGRAVEVAAEKQVRSEKLRAELITNVSHDIKTPLTSIINYIDLLGREDFDNQTAREYIDVLQKQSTRLKKLLEDVVEASKASTGNFNANFVRINLATLLGQAVGEYTDKAQNAGLELDMSVYEDEAYICSDGRLLWRVFDNLLANACKYSMPGTRVYIICEKSEDKHIITFKNISKSKLNISPNELMERFVRGDSSRNTEGSGLGLSIAQSLMSILNGEMSLSIDGDLFKVTLTFTAVK